MKPEEAAKAAAVRAAFVRELLAMGGITLVVVGAAFADWRAGCVAAGLILSGIGFYGIHNAGRKSKP